ncbi:MAG: IS481 family transposase [Acidimicrobiales bacterium]
MGLARYVVDAVVIDGRSMREVARAHGVSKSWVAVLLARYREGGYDALEPRSRRPRTVPTRTSDAVEDAIVELRKRLGEEGFDAGPETIRWHLERRGLPAPSPSTIWRVLVRRGFVTPEPRKRPRTSYIRFESQLPNETWQSDITHWALADGRDVEILDFIDDHSRLVVAATCRPITKAADVVATFHDAAARFGYPASLLSDNGAVYNANSRKGRTVLQLELERLGIVYKHSRPYHPETCGKIERFHQTLKKFLDRQEPATTISELQGQVDRFVAYYNEERPHRARHRMTPRQAFDARDKARPGSPVAATHFRVREDRIDAGGNVTLRYDSKLLKIGVGRAHKHTAVRLYVADLDVRVVSFEGELLRQLTLDPSRIYQARGRPQR